VSGWRAVRPHRPKIRQGGHVRDPRYQQIADDLRAKIERGDYAPGSQLPTEKELRLLYSASRNTVREAVRVVVNLGLVQPQAGRGTFVAERIDPFVITLSRGPGVGGDTAQYLSDAREREPFNSPPRVEVQAASAAPELGLAADASVVSRHQERFLDGRPWSLQTTFYPMDLVHRGADRLLWTTNIEPGAVRYLSDELNLAEAGWRDQVIVRVPDGNEEAFFQLPDDGRVAIIEIRRTAYEKSGKPLRLTVTTCPADRNELLFTTGQVPATSAALVAANGATPVGTKMPSSG
jgi:GntR family transcriptional regulator